MNRFVFDLTHDRWLWKAIDESGKIVKRCKGSFPYYLDCVEDAKAHGFAGRPYFVSPKGEIVSGDVAENESGGNNARSKQR